MTRNIRLKDLRHQVIPASFAGSTVEFVAQECIKCGACTVECLFLREHGTPGHIAEIALRGDTVDHVAFSCSLCRLCTHRCPKQLPISDMFLELRRIAVAGDKKILKDYAPLRFYESLGASRFFSGYFLPDECDTVFFPGCTLPGIRPEQTEQLFIVLQKKFTKLGLVLDCCGQASHNLGDQEGFVTRNTRQIKKLRDSGVHHVITSCPSCFQAFSKDGTGIEVSMAYSHLAEMTTFSGKNGRSTDKKPKYSVHDPCTARFDRDVQESVRRLISLAGGTVAEMEHSGMRTLCCGEGGSVGFVQKKYKLEWQRRRKDEMDSLPMVTYCAGCSVSLASPATTHILDLVFPGKDGGNPPLVKQLMRYLNRLFFKKKMKRYLKVS